MIDSYLLVRGLLILAIFCFSPIFALAKDLRFAEMAAISTLFSGQIGRPIVETGRHRSNRKQKIEVRLIPAFTWGIELEYCRCLGISVSHSSDEPCLSKVKAFSNESNKSTLDRYWLHRRLGSFRMVRLVRLSTILDELGQESYYIIHRRMGEDIKIRIVNVPKKADDSLLFDVEILMINGKAIRGILDIGKGSSNNCDWMREIHKWRLRQIVALIRNRSFQSLL